ncbi:UPF0678 fatty acid-binding protein-like protein At1g79260 isoform X3 [Cucumis sativus]|uniref:UPF0678 fatty acid-binding protein-like protein At1g79260 isoform X3 n=1 Tax=Cucumis sativus TaxID=3659 RepID=UPI0012F4BEF2|nr:UPF0678 fatty acid-binding protein-like protein At1g79260 isoform X3 [Cucumis sativus]
MDGELPPASAPAPAPAPLSIHPAVTPLSFLLGTWRGKGEGGFPTINSFSYGEELHFSHSGKPVISYSQKTWKLDSKEPMHAESGYWRPKPDGTIEVVIAQSTGLVEVQVLSAETKPPFCPHLALSFPPKRTAIFSNR